MDSTGQFRQRLMVVTAVGFLGFLLVAGPALAANYLTTKISDPAYQKWDAHPTSTGEIVLVANPTSSAPYGGTLTYEGQAIYLYQNHVLKKITFATFNHWSYSSNGAGKYLLDGTGPNSSTIFLNGRQISTREYYFWNAEWCGDDVLLYGNTVNTTAKAGRVVYLYKDGVATKISNDDYMYWAGQTTGSGVLLYGNIAPPIEDTGAAVYLYYNKALMKISTRDYTLWKAEGWDQKVILDGEAGDKSEIYLYDGAATTKISQTTFPKWDAHWLTDADWPDADKIIMLGNPTAEMFEAEALYTYVGKVATRITNSTYKYWKYNQAIVDGTFYNQLLLDGRTADNARSAIYLYKAGSTVLISPTAYLRWDAYWDYQHANNRGRIVLIGDPTVLPGAPSGFSYEGKALYLYTGTPAVKVSNSSYSYWRFDFDSFGYAPAGQLLMLAGNTSYSASAVYLYAGGVTKIINPLGHTSWDAHWDSLARIVMTGSKMIYPDYRSAVYLYKGATTPKISTAAYPYWYCWDWYQDGAGKHLLQGTDLFNPGSAMYLYNLTNTVKISPADYKYWNGIWHSNTLAVLIGSTASVYDYSGKAIYVSSGAAGVKVSTGEYTDWDYLQDYMSYKNHPLLLKGRDAANTKSAIYLVEPDTRPYSKYSFTFSYNNGLGDWYKGYFYAPTGYNGYKVGYEKSFIDENNQDGKYTIDFALDIGQDSSRYGQVFVTQYFDGDQSKKTFTPLNYTSPLGTNFLGSELGYIKNPDVGVYQFGKGFYEADAGDTYTYRYTYNNGTTSMIGDYYEGKFYRDPLSTTYFPGQKIYKVNELGLKGYYEIKAVSHSKVAAASYGQIFVNKYYDGDKTGKSIPVVNPAAYKGTASLGSEVGYIKNAGVAVYQFGKGFYEADAGDTYTYRYTYNNGDYYEGKFYRDPLSATYYPGQKISKVNELGKTGYYEIKGVSHSKVAAASYGQIFVNKYYDGDKTGKSVPVVNPAASKGKTSLGSELGYIKNTGVSVYMFGKGYYEADAGDTYTYRYTYGNGDYYEGKVYRDPVSTSYYPGQKINVVNELGKTGYYEIKGVSHSKVASSLYGKVYVTKYYDGDKTTPKAYTGAQLLPTNPMYTWFGAGYLKTEHGYIGSRATSVSPNYFGKGFYEADL